MKNKNKRKNIVSVACSTVGTILLLLIVCACVPLTLPRIMGYQIYTVVTGSMEPEIPVGSIVYVKAIAPEELQEEDVIAFYGGRDTNAIITHRVVKNNVISGQITTKGDANKTEDMNPVAYSDVIGIVEYTLPKAGELAQLFTSGKGKMAAAGVVAAAIVFHVIGSIVDKRK